MSIESASILYILGGSDVPQPVSSLPVVLLPVPAALRP